MPRILMADDDLNLLELSAEILRPHAEVECVSQTAQALRLICQNPYDLLITDLNIEHASDGLLLAGAMRALQPAAHTVLITGYPDFTGAVAAFQGTLDRVLVKPVDLKELLRLPLMQPAITLRPTGAGQDSLWRLLEREQGRILDEWLKLAESDPQLGSIKISVEARLDHMCELMGGLSKPQSRHGQEQASAEKHGRERRRLGFRTEWIFLEMSYLRRSIFEAILRGLLDLDLSRFPQDLFSIILRLDADLLDSLRAFGLSDATPPV